MPTLAPVPTPAAAAAQAVDPAATALADRWYAAAKLLQNRGLVSGMAETLAMHSGLQRVDDGTTPARWTLCVEREMLRTPALRDKLQAALVQALEHPVDIELEAGIPDDSPHKRDTAERARRQAAAVAAIEADPLVRDLLSQYATARIVPGSIKPVESKET
jgi:DNA polymerase-3 subunit gamma/tau